MHEYMIQGILATESEFKHFEGLSTPDQLKFVENLKSRGELITIKPVEPQVAGSVEATLAQRGSRYGDFTDHARLCQQLMGTMQSFSKVVPGLEAAKEGDKDYFKPWEYLDPVKRQALTVIADKIARILSGDPNYDDNWHDIQGYAKLAEDRLPKKESH